MRELRELKMLVYENLYNPYVCIKCKTGRVCKEYDLDARTYIYVCVNCGKEQQPDVSR